jgi:hypothetical protein
MSCLTDDYERLPTDSYSGVAGVAQFDARQIVDAARTD